MLKKTVEQIADGYYEVDLLGNFTYINDHLAHLLGHARDTITAPGRRHFSDYTDDATSQQITDAFSNIFTNGTPDGLIEGKFIHPDGSSGYAEISVAKIKDETDTIIGYCGIVRDVTRRRTVEEMLDRRVKLLAILQQVDVELNHTLDVERVLSTAMSAAMILSNADAGGIGLMEGDQVRMGRVAGRYNQQADAPQGGIVGRVIRTRRPDLVTDVLSDPDYLPLLSDAKAQIACPMLIHDKMVGILVLETSDPARFTNEVFEFVQLLTARIAAAIDNAQLYGVAQQQLDELRALNTQLQELEQLKSDMIRIASHDLRSPLGIIGGYLSIIHEDLEPQLTSAHEQYFEAMMQGLDRIDRLTTDFLSLERIQTAKQLPREAVDIDMLVNKAVYDARSLALHKQLTFDVELLGAPLLVTGEESDLYEAIVNLVGNAIKYTPQMGRVFVRLTVADNQACFTVEDTGIGIPNEYQSRLFQSFFRVKTLETRDIPGTGLGLHLVKKIVDRHHGNVIFHSVHGQGSMFGFSLPLYPLSLEREGSESRSIQM
ncbi:MAG: ATP-binding protein [Chloroflexota bacterium]|nr:ATP-binding protein [Chloroflexota bacterium]